MTLFDNMFVGNEKVDTLIDVCVFSRVIVYTKKLAKVATFFIWVYLLVNLLLVFINKFYQKEIQRNRKEKLEDNIQVKFNKEH